MHLLSGKMRAGAGSVLSVPEAVFQAMPAAQGTSSFSSVSIGAADPNRRVVVVVYLEKYTAGGGAGTLAGPSSVTCNGDAMTQVVSQYISSEDATVYTTEAYCAIYEIAQSALTTPTATTATIVVNGATANVYDIATYRVLSTGASVANQTGTVAKIGTDSTSGTVNLSASINRPANTVVIGGAACNGTNGGGLLASGLTWSGTGDMAEATDVDQEQANGQHGLNSAASKFFSGADATYVQSFTWTRNGGGYAGALCVATWEA